jgi:hypothetical protein
MYHPSGETALPCYPIKIAVKFLVFIKNYQAQVWGVVIFIMLLAGFVSLLQVTFFALLEDFYLVRLTVKDRDKTSRIISLIHIMWYQIIGLITASIDWSGIVLCDNFQIRLVGDRDLEIFRLDCSSSAAQRFFDRKKWSWGKYRCRVDCRSCQSPTLCTGSWLIFIGMLSLQLAFLRVGFGSKIRSSWKSLGSTQQSISISWKRKNTPGRSSRT